MKKLLLVTLLSGFVMNAQAPDKGTIEIAPAIGLGISDYMSDYLIDNNNYDPLYSVTAGVNLDIYFNSLWSIRSGIHYQIMGAESYISPGWYTEQLDYVTIPVHANIHFGKTKRWNAHFGPSFSFLLDAQAEYIKERASIVDEVNKVQLSFGFGIGHKIPLNDFMALGLEYNHQIGLTSVFKYNDYYYETYPNNYYYDDDRTKNSFGAFSVSLIFKLGEQRKEE